MKTNNPWQVLEIGLEAGDEDVRAAYLRKVKEYPPDRAPQEFECVRDAYEALRDRRQRAQRLILSADPRQPLASLLNDRKSGRQFVGLAPWLAVLREKKR